MLIPAEGAKNPPPIEKKANGNQDLEKVLRPPSEKLTVQDMTELIQILNLAVKAHSSNYQPSPAMIEAFFSRVMEGFSAYGDAPAAPDGLPSVREVYEYAEDPGGMLSFSCLVLRRRADSTIQMCERLRYLPGFSRTSSSFRLMS